MAGAADCARRGWGCHGVVVAFGGGRVRLTATAGPLRRRPVGERLVKAFSTPPCSTPSAPSSPPCSPPSSSTNSHTSEACWVPSPWSPGFTSCCGAKQATSRARGRRSTPKIWRRHGRTRSSSTRKVPSPSRS